MRCDRFKMVILLLSLMTGCKAKEKELPEISIHMSDVGLAFVAPVGECEEEVLTVENTSTSGLSITLAVSLQEVEGDALSTGEATWMLGSNSSISLPIRCCPKSTRNYSGNMAVLASSEDGQSTGQTVTLVCSGVAEDLDGDEYKSDVDCDDQNPSVHPGAIESANAVDDNCNNIVDEGTESYDDDGDGYTERVNDCDDGNPAINPGMPEMANGVDDNCNEMVDEGTPYADLDGDHCVDEDDCNDLDATVHPGQADVGGNNIDDNCSGDQDDADDDGDGVSEVDGDCNDVDSTISPKANEGTGNGDNVDQDCDGTTDEGTRDYDDDGDGLSENNGDCDDHNSTVYPGAPDARYDGVDQDCDGNTDG